MLTNLSITVKSKDIKNDLIIRISYDEIPPKVEYKLSQKGESIVPILQSICKWAGVTYNDDPNFKSICKRCNYKKD